MKIYIDGKTILISDVDYIYLAGFTWWLNNSGYAYTYLNNKMQSMHQIIARRMCLDTLDKQIDHINSDRLDNRRKNLRVATRRQNNQNSIKSRRNTCGYKGVIWNKVNRRWQARIIVEGKQIHLGCFDGPEEAHNAYCKAAKKYFGEFARTE